MFRRHAMIVTATVALSATTALALPPVQEGTDANSAANPFVQPLDPPAPGNGRDQSMQFADVLEGTRRRDVQIGHLGNDIMRGRSGNDVMVGGPEHFNPANRDRAFGEAGNDIFIWAPGDGSDFFDGGRGYDAVIFGRLDEIQDGQVVNGVFTDQETAEVFLDEQGLPQVNVTDSPGFCPIIDGSDDAAAQSLDALGLDHLVQFVIRGLRASFEAGEQDTDNGLRVTLHLKDVEYVVCAPQEGPGVLIFDLTQAPAQIVSLEQVRSAALRRSLATIVR